MPKLSRKKIEEHLHDDYPLDDQCLDALGFNSDALHLGEAGQKEVDEFFEQEEGRYYYGL